MTFLSSRVGLSFLHSCLFFSPVIGPVFSILFTTSTGHVYVFLYLHGSAYFAAIGCIILKLSFGTFVRIRKLNGTTYWRLSMYILKYGSGFGTNASLLFFVVHSLQVMLLIINPMLLTLASCVLYGSFPLWLGYPSCQVIWNYVIIIMFPLQ